MTGMATVETYYVVQRDGRYMCPSDGNGGVIWGPSLDDAERMERPDAENRAQFLRGAAHRVTVVVEDVASDRVAVLTDNQYIVDMTRVRPVEWELGPSPMLGQVNCGERWLPADHAYGYALRIIAATEAVHKAAKR